MTVLRRGMREDLSFLLLAMALSLTSQGEMSSSRLVSPDLSDLLLMMLPLVVVVKWLFVSLLLLVVSWLLMVLLRTTDELDLARLEAASIIN